MTRRRFYAPPSAFAFGGQTLTLSAGEARHARDVLRLQRGDEVYVFEGAGKEFRCALREFTRDGALLDLLEEVKPERPESPVDLNLALALLKGEKFDLVVQKGCELGLRRIIPVTTVRADVRVRDEEDARRRVTRWRRIALEATKQCGRARVMQVDEPMSFISLIKRAEDGELKLMFAEREGKALAEAAAVSQSPPSKAIALVGSEGGWTDDEIDQARGCGWNIVTLGGRTLRAETAAIVAATLLQHRFGDLT